MKKLIAVSAFALTLGVVGNSFAGFNGQPQAQAGGFTGPTIATSSVAEASKLGDDTPVILVGQIEKNLGNEKYQFKDKTGTIVVEIDHEDWAGVNVSPENTVELRGEIDKDMFKTEVDVDQVILKK